MRRKIEVEGNDLLIVQTNKDEISIALTGFITVRWDDRSKVICMNTQNVHIWFVVLKRYQID